MDASTSNNIKHRLILGLFFALAVIFFGLVWLFFFAPVNPSGFGWYLFSFAAGLSMIVLPCTLPLAFVIVPLSMGRGVIKGFSIAVAFGLGVALTLSLYGVAAALVGGAAIGSLGAPLEVVKNWVYFIAGIFAYLFALGEIGLIKFRMPTYSGAMPAFIQRQSDVVKALLLGLFLGNIGVGCPHPATPLILVEIATSGNVFYGWSLFFIHALGRVLPLLFLAVLGILGVNGLSFLVARRDKVEKATGWAMVFVGAFILVLGLFSHGWWVNSGIHTGLEKITQEETLLNLISSRVGAANVHRHGLETGTGLFGLPLSLGNWVLVLLWVWPLWWWYGRRKKEITVIPELNTVPEKLSAQQTLSAKKYLFVVLTFLLGLIFIYVLPNNFASEQMLMTDEHMMEEDMDQMRMGHDSLYHEESDVQNGLAVNFLKPKEAVLTAVATPFKFFVNSLPGSVPVENLDLVHEKYIHVLGVRDDLTQFFHIHPEKIGPGLWQVDHTFSKPGTYKMWSDVSYQGMTHSFGHQKFLVQAGEEYPLLEPPDEIRYVEFFKNVIVGDYQVGVEYPEPIVAGRDTPFDFTVKDVLGNGVKLENYLGEPMHLTVIKDDLFVYLHTHPEDHAGGMMMPNDTHSSNIFGATAFANGVSEEERIPGAHISFSVNFSSTGLYKMFGQFRPEGIGLPKDETLLAQFYVRVQGTGPAYPVAEENSSAAPPSKSGLVLVSLSAVAILGWGVYRFINVKS